MPELPDLSPIPGGNVSDDDILLIYDFQNGRAYKVTRGALLGNVARTNAAATFTDLTADSATFTELTPALLTFAGGGGIADMLTASETVAVPTLAAQASQAVNVAVAGADASMAALVTISDGLAAGLTYHSRVSAADTVTITFTNASAGSITGASKTAKIMLFALP